MTEIRPISAYRTRATRYPEGVPLVTLGTVEEGGENESNIFGGEFRNIIRLWPVNPFPAFNLCDNRRLTTVS